MKKSKIVIENKAFDIYSVENIVIGSGCAAFNCADWLYDLGKKDTLILTEGIKINC